MRDRCLQGCGEHSYNERGDTHRGGGMSRGVASSGSRRSAGPRIATWRSTGDGRAALSATIDALERNGATPAELSAAIEGQAVSDGARAFSRAWHALSVRRARLGSSDAEAIVAATDLLREEDSVLRGLDAIVIENLPLHTRVERELIAALVSAAPSDVISRDTTSTTSAADLSS